MFFRLNFESKKVSVFLCHIGYCVTPGVMHKSLIRQGSIFLVGKLFIHSTTIIPTKRGKKEFDGGLDHMVLSVPDNTFVLGWIKVKKIMVLQYTSRGGCRIFAGWVHYYCVT